MKPAICAVLCLIAAGAWAGELQLDVGGQKLLELPEGAKVSVEKPEILDAKRLGGGQLLLIGQAPGVTRLEVTGKQTWTVTVHPSDSAKVVSKIRALLPGIEGLQLVDGRCLRVECDGCSAAQSRRVEEVMGLYSCVKTVHRLGAPRDAAKVIAGVQQILGATAGLTVAIVDGKAWLRGTASTDEAVRRVEQAREAFHELRIRVRLPAGG